MFASGGEDGTIRYFDLRARDTRDSSSSSQANRASLLGEQCRAGDSLGAGNERLSNCAGWMSHMQAVFFNEQAVNAYSAMHGVSTYEA